MTDERLHTREEVVALIKQHLGAPMTLSTLEKACSDGFGPEPAAKFGKRYLYTEASALAFGRSLHKPPVANKRPQRAKQEQAA